MTDGSTELREKLTVAVAIDYPEAAEILVSFPDKWELVHQIRRGDDSLYIAGLPIRDEPARVDHFYGLAPEINLDLTKYRMYKAFEPWPQPSIQVSWDPNKGEGRVEGYGATRVTLIQLGVAQAWRGERYGLIWECYYDSEGRQRDNWQEELRDFWRAVEQDLGVEKIFTAPHEPAFAEGYTDFLQRLGYASDPTYPRWWSKEIE